MPASSGDGGVFRVPAFDILASAEHVLIAGAGGGFDVFAGLPLFFSLQRQGRRVSLANHTFSWLQGTGALQLGEVLWRVSGAELVPETAYFPEKYLAEWLAAHGHPHDVYCFESVGVRPLRAAYQTLARALRVDAIVLVDGGTDILMRGDEAGLGTPAEDMASLAAAYATDVPTRIVSCLGFGVDAFHGVCHAHFLENVAALSAAGGYLGTHSLHLAMPEVALYREAVEYVHARMPERPSIVNGSIVSALEGGFGNVQRTARTASSPLFINPLMSMYWHFDLQSVAERSLYLASLDDTESIADVQDAAESYWRSAARRARQAIPV